MQLSSRTTAIAGLVLCLVAGNACSQGPDVSSEVNRALKEANLPTVTVDWDRKDHIAHLKGIVETTTDKQRAHDVAAAAVGTTGRVLNELTIKGINDTTAGDLDGTIRSHLKKMMKNDALLKDRDIDFEVSNGVVTVKGEVYSAAEKSRVSDLVRESPGVKDMANAVAIKPAAK